MISCGGFIDKVKMDKIYETDDINDIGGGYVCDNSQCGVLDRK